MCDNLLEKGAFLRFKIENPTVTGIDNQKSRGRQFLKAIKVQKSLGGILIKEKQRKPYFFSAIKRPSIENKRIFFLMPHIATPSKFSTLFFFVFPLFKKNFVLY